MSIFHTEEEHSVAGDVAKDTLLVLGGVLIGVAIGMLYAPQPGTKTRKQIGKSVNKKLDQANGVKSDVLDKVDDLRSSLADQIEDGAEFVGEKREALLEGINGLQSKINVLKSKISRS